MALHVLEPERANLHGQFSRELPPALVAESGDTVRLRTLDVGWGLEPPTTATAPRRKFEPRIPPRDDGPALCGPIAVRGAEPGVSLEITLAAIEPGRWGWTWAGGGMGPLDAVLHVDAVPSQLLRWELDPVAMVGTNQYGQRVTLRPFLGTIGLAADLPGWQSGRTPRHCGGNMDCKELVAGSRLFLPIAVPGALLSVGDGHARQGNGEVGGMAIECMLERVELGLRVRDDLPLTPHVPGRRPAGSRWGSMRISIGRPRWP